MSKGSKKRRANLEGIGGTGGGAAAADRPEASDPITVLKELWTHSPESRARLVVFGAMVVLVVVLYHFQGNSLDVPNYTRSLFRYLYTRWTGADSNYGHGPIVVLVSCWLVWRKREELLATTKNPNWLGLLGIAAALALHWIGLRGQLPRISAFSLLLLMWSSVLHLWGWRTAKIVIFPIGFLFFVIPLGFLDTSVAVRMRILASTIAVDTLKVFGLDVTREGTMLFFNTGDAVGSRFRLDVAAPCSGIRSLIALSSLTAVYAYLTQRNHLKQLILFASAIPLAIIGNVARITLLGLIAQGFGEEVLFRELGIPLRWMAKDLHEMSGYLVFVIAIALMFLIGSFLDKNWKETFLRWKASLISPTSSPSA
ncbi:MAG: exosortase/archaeosortase family protein [Verrucomicrobiota bacterium]|jgi:exosortase